MTGRKKAVAAATTLVLAAAFIGAMAAGCNRSPNVFVGKEGYTGDLAASLIVNNPGLQKKIALVEGQSRRINNLLNVTVVLQSMEKKTLNFEYRFLWYGADGFEIRDTTSHWAPEMIYGLERKRLEATAPMPGAVTFKLMVRAPEPVER